jgi:hypothetical protein
VYAENMAHALAKALENDIIGIFTSTNPSRTVNASTAGIKSSDLEAAIAIVESYSIPREECIWFFHPKAYNIMCHLVEILISKSRKLRENLKHLFETIRSETQKWGRSETIIGIPSFLTG